MIVITILRFYKNQTTCLIPLHLLEFYNGHILKTLFFTKQVFFFSSLLMQLNGLGKKRMRAFLFTPTVELKTRYCFVTQSLFTRWIRIIFFTAKQRI